MEPRDQKRVLRQEIEGLDPAPPSVRAAVVRHVGAWLGVRRPAVVVGFLAMGSEIDMTPLVTEHPEIRFALTRTAPGTNLTVHDFDGPRERHAFGFEQPAEDAPEIPKAAVDVVLVPGIAFTPDGKRLGRGAGYYDRFLADFAGDTVALTTTSRIRPDLPFESHDVRVRWVATEDGVIPARP